MSVPSSSCPVSLCPTQLPPPSSPLAAPAYFDALSASSFALSIESTLFACNSMSRSSSSYPASLSYTSWLQRLTAVAAGHVQQCSELVLNFSHTIHEQSTDQLNTLRFPLSPPLDVCVLQSALIGVACTKLVMYHTCITQACLQYTASEQASDASSSCVWRLWISAGWLSGPGHTCRLASTTKHLCAHTVNLWP